MRNWNRSKPVICSLFLLWMYTISYFGHAQNPLRFEKWIDSLSLDTSKSAIEHPILFVGSSSISMWSTIGTDLASEDIINNGFGGSHFSDLIFHMESLVFQYDPKAVFIYKGDNDLGVQNWLSILHVRHGHVIG